MLRQDHRIQAALDALAKTILQDMTLVSQSIFANSVEAADQTAKGVAIYYLDPSKLVGAIDNS